MMEACTDSESFSEDLYLDLDDDEDCVEGHKEISPNEMDSAISKLQDSGCVVDGSMNDAQMELFDELLVAENKKRLEKEKQGKQQSKNLLKENEELRSAYSAMERKDKMLEEQNKQLKEENEQLKKELENTKNMKDSFIGELLDEIKTRDCLIIDLRAEIDRLVFRRNLDHRDNSYSNRHAKYRSDDRSSDGGSRGKKDKGHKRKSTHAEEDSDDISRSNRTSSSSKDSKKCKSTVSTKKPSAPLPDLVSKHDCPTTSNKDVAEPDELDVSLVRVNDHQQSSVHVNSEQKAKNKVSSSGSVTVCDDNLETTPRSTRSANESEHSSTSASSEAADSACQSIAPAIASAPTVSEDSEAMEQNLVDDDSDPPLSQEKQHGSENGAKPPKSCLRSTENSEVMVSSSEHPSTSGIPNELQRALKEFEERQALAFNLLKTAFCEYEVKQGHSTGNLKRAVNDFYSATSPTQTLQTQNQSECLSRSINTKQAADTLAAVSEESDEHQFTNVNISVGQCSTPVETFTPDSSSKDCERDKKTQNNKDGKSTHDLDLSKQKEKDSRQKDENLANLAKTVVIANLGASKSSETKHSERPSSNYSRNASPLENLYKDSHDSRDQTYSRRHVSDSWKQASAADPRLYRNRSYSGRFQSNSDYDSTHSTQKHTDHHDKSHHSTNSAEKSEVKGRSERSPTRSKEHNSTDVSSHKVDKIVPDIKVQSSSTSKNVTEKNINLFKITGEAKNLYQKRLIDKLNRELIESQWSSGEVASVPNTPSPEVEKSSSESRHKTSIKKTYVRKNSNAYSPVKSSLSNRSEHYLRKRKFHKITQSPSMTTDRIPTPLKNDAIKLFHYQNLPVPFAVKRNLGMLKKKGNSESPGTSSSELPASTDEQITKTSQNQDTDGDTHSDKKTISSSQNGNSSTARNDVDSQKSDHSSRSVSGLSKNSRKNNVPQDENETVGNSPKVTDNSDMLDASD